MNRCLKLSVLAALTLASSQALALDLGQIQVKSALDRPLVAEIPLHPDHPGEADHLQVSLAPASAFAQAGISRANLKVPLNFTVVTHADGQKFIRVTSTQPVREPYLDFLIQVTWPKGKMLREYTVLLDPLSADSTPATTTPAAAGARAAQKQAPAPQPAAPEASQPSSSHVTKSSDIYGPVPHGDTLSHIARANAIDGVSYQQMLVALKAANPDAFFKDNVNALKTGAVLRIPTRQEAQAVTRKAAIAAVRKQNQAWQASRDTAPTMVAGSGGASTPVTGSGSGTTGGDHLALVPPEAGGSASAGAAGGGDASASQLRQDLARSQEALSSQKQSAADLRSRVTALEQLQSKNKRLLSLKNAEIAELQDKLADARKAAGLPALPASVAQTGMAAAASVANSPVASAASVAGVRPAASASTAGTAAAATSTSTATMAAAPVAAQAKAAQPQPAATPVRREASTPWYEQLWARVALGIVIVLLLIWVFLRRRSPGNKQSRSSLAEHFGDSPLGPDGATAAEDGGDEPAHEPLADDDGEHELLAQLAEHPDDIGLHLELASLYYARRDADQFEAAAEAMHAYVDDESQPEWQDVLAMGRDLAPDHPLFAASAATPDDHASAIDDHLEPTADDTGEDWSAESRVPDASDDADQPRSSGYSFDFDLVPESNAAADKPESASPEASDAVADGMPDESEFDALPPLPSEPDEPVMHEDDAFDMPESTSETQAQGLAHELSMDDAAEDFVQEGTDFSDDPVDTKLDLARAYIDMGDHEGARAMLHEAINEGSQMQKDTARKLLDELG